MITDIDGKTDVLSLAKYSSKKVKKSCDNCGKISIVKLSDVTRSRLRRSTTRDYCFNCAIQIYNTGEGNVAKLAENRKKISEKTKWKSKKFKNDKNSRIINKKLTTNGYLQVYNTDTKQYMLEHRKIIEKNMGIELKKEDIIHHINGDKLDNQINNLLITSSSKEHQIIHRQLETIALGLVSKGIIKFSKANKTYYVSPEIDLEVMPISLGFDDVAISQNKNICTSRLDVNIKSEAIKGIWLKTPMIASNMSTVCNSDFIIALNKLGAMGIMHRATNEEEILDEIEKISKECQYVAASIGIGNNQFDFAKKLIKNGTNIICIDVAHGYNDMSIQLGKKIKLYDNNVKIIIGNVVNPNIIYEVYDFADAIKIGIAQGFVCETKNTAGCTEKQFSAVYKFKHLSKEFGIPVISDGAIREPADFVKSIGAGANSIMAGKIFAACPESAAAEINIEGHIKKIYAGMSSRYVQNVWKGGLKKGTCSEGGIKYLDIGESVQNLLERYSGALKSGITYGGANDIGSFQKNVRFVRIIK